MDTEIVTITYRTSEQIGPQDWSPYTDVFHFGLENTLADVIRALRARHHTDSYGETHAEIHYSKKG